MQSRQCGTQKEADLLLPAIQLHIPGKPPDEKGSLSILICVQLLNPGLTRLSQGWNAMQCHTAALVSLLDCDMGTMLCWQQLTTVAACKKIIVAERQLELGGILFAGR
eukprot:scaffold246527_cov19-Tisochrysis_lutea.AAC.1